MFFGVGGGGGEKIWKKKLSTLQHFVVVAMMEDNHCPSTKCLRQLSMLATTIHDLEEAVQNVFEWRNLIANFMQATKPFRSIVLDQFLRIFEEYYLRSCWRKVVDTLYLVLSRANDAIYGYLRFDPDPCLATPISDSLCDYQHFNVSSWPQLQANCEWQRVRF